MRILLTILFLATIGFVSLQAQTKTFDIKCDFSSEGDLGEFHDFQQISATRILAQARYKYGYSYFAAINNTNGMIDTNRWRFPLWERNTFYHFDSQTNTLVLLAIERTGALNQEKLHLILLDSNLREKSNIILDSTVTGIPTVFDNIKFDGIILLDSSILLISYSPYEFIKGNVQAAIHISKDGRFLSSKSITDTSKSIIYKPLFQMQTGEIVYCCISSSSSYYYSLWTSDTEYKFASSSIIDGLYGSYSPNCIYTKDNGIAVAYDNGEGTTVIKYDENFKKQWLTVMKYVGYSYRIKLIERSGGGYFITASTVDTTAFVKFPEYAKNPGCLRDIVLSCIDTSGNVLFNSYYGTEICTEIPYDMIEDYTDGGVIISGIYSGSDPSALGSHCDFQCENPYTTWLFKVDSMGEPAKNKVVTGLKEKIGSTNNDIRLFPNPASGVLTIEFGRSHYFTSIEIIDGSGRILQTSPLEPTVGRKNIDISMLSSGSYFCRLRAQSDVVSRPFVIQR